MTKFINKADQTARTWRFWLLGRAMPRKVNLWLMTVLTLALLPISVSATVITYAPSFLGGSQWQYDYTVAAAASDPTIDEFTIFFDPTLYANLVAAATPSGWDPLVIQPDTSIPADGYFDALALVAGISPGTSQGGFAVSFDFLGNGTPGLQSFDIVDPNTFATLSSGFTSIASSSSTVPEPNTLALVCLALALLLIFRNRFSKT